MARGYFFYRFFLRLYNVYDLLPHPLQWTTATFDYANPSVNIIIIFEGSLHLPRESIVFSWEERKNMNILSMCLMIDIHIACNLSDIHYVSIQIQSIINGKSQPLNISIMNHSTIRLTNFCTQLQYLFITLTKYLHPQRILFRRYI